MKINHEKCKLFRVLDMETDSVMESPNVCMTDQGDLILLKPTIEDKSYTFEKLNMNRYKLLITIEVSQ